jgi:1,4-dihydroxy-2-naphthoate polyprenyltransferase
MPDSRVTEPQTVSKPESKAAAWVLAMRPKAYPATIAPVLLGSAMAYADGMFNWLVMLVALVCAMLLQTASNFINDIYDSRKGADNDDRLGAKKVITSGLISEQTLIRVTIGVMVVAFALGMILVWIGGWVILAIGLLSMLFAWAYTGGPYPLAYHALGDVTVILFYGVAAVSGTYYAHTVHVSFAVLALSLAPAFLASNILGVNNLRDIPTDTKANKTTLAVLLGESNARRLYYLQAALAFAVPVVLWQLGYKWFVMLPLILSPLAVKECIGISKRTGKALNESLGGTARLLMLFGALLALGLFLSKP